MKLKNFKATGPSRDKADSYAKQAEARVKAFLQRRKSK